MSFSEFLKGQTFVLIQWLYAIWQIARDTTFVNSVFYLFQMLMKGQLNFVFRKNTNIQYDRHRVPFTQMDGNRQPDVIHISKKYSLGKLYDPPCEDFRKEYLDNESKRNINGVELKAYNQWWYTVKFNGSYYFCHQNILFEWAMYDIDKLILLKEVELIGNELVMGTVISKEEMFEAMLSMEYHINELYAPCIFGKQYNIGWNLRLSAFLATIPLVLQAKGMANESALCTLILIVVDIVRTPLLRLYELFMSYLTREVKLWVFRECKHLYIFFSWFSKRWAACDRRYGYAYYTTAKDEKSVFPVTTFVKFKNEDDCKFDGVDRRAKPCIESYGFQINNGVIHSAELSYGDHCLYIKVKEGFFVSSIDAPTMMKYNHYSKFQPDMEVLAKVFNCRCDMRKVVMWGLAKILEIQILKRGVAILRKILDKKQQESIVDNLLQTAGDKYMTQELLNRGGESDIMDDRRKKLRATQLALINVTKEEIRNVLYTFHGIPELPADNIRASITSLMATTASDVLVVELLQGEYRVKKPIRFVSMFEKLGNVDAALAILFSSSWYRTKKIDGKKEVMIGYFSDSAKDACRFSATWHLYKAQEDLRKVAENFGIKLTMFHGRGVTVGRGGSPTHLVILMCPETIRGSSLQVTVQGEVTEQSFGEEHLCFRTLRTFTVAASLDHRKHPPKPEWRELMDEMALVGPNKEYSRRSGVSVALIMASAGWRVDSRNALLLICMLAIMHAWATVNAAMPPGRNAYATMMYMGTPRDYEFYVAVRVMLRSLRRLNVDADLVLIASRDVPSSWINKLHGDGVRVVMVDNMENPYRHQSNFDKRFTLTLNKLYAWNLVEYERVVMLDADNLFLQKTDELFQCGQFCAVFINPCIFHTGLFVLQPSQVVFNDMLNQLANGRENEDGADQGFLTGYFHDMLGKPMFRPKLNGSRQNGLFRLPLGYQMDASYYYLKLRWSVPCGPNSVITFPGASWLKPWYWWSWPVLPLGISWHKQRLDTIGYGEELPVFVIEAIIYLMIIVIAKFRGFFLNTKGYYFYRGPDREHCRHPVFVRAMGISCLLGGYLIPCLLIPKTIHPLWGWGLYLLGSLSLVYSTIKAYPIPVLAAFTLWLGIFGVLVVMAYPEYPDGVVRAISVFVYAVVAIPVAWSAIIRVARSLDSSIDRESQSPLSDQLIKAC